MRTAVVTVAYNRLNSLKRLLKSLLEADYCGDKVDLIISIDKSDTKILEDFADEFHWYYGYKTVQKHKKNLGLREHILSQGKAFDIYDALVILEDDIIVSPAFYKFTKQSIAFFHNNNDIAGISLYSFPLIPYNNYPFEPLKNGYDVYMMQTAQSWGQVWMKNQWLNFYDWYKKNLDFLMSEEIPSTLFSWKKSWLKYHTRYCIENNKYFVYPYHAFSTNSSEAGVHSKDKYSNYETSMQMEIARDFIFPESIQKAIRYDAFFENEDCYETLCLNKSNCTLNLNGLRNSSKRYLLTSQHHNFKIIRSFGLSRHPIEANILQNVHGDALYLYDTESPREKFKQDNTYNITTYRYRLYSMITLIKNYGLKNILIESLKLIIRKI